MSAGNRLDDLRRISDAALEVFRGAGADEVGPDILQPADPFLDLLGENIRSRTYVFTDPGGAELCLRPDLTLPVARIYKKRNPECTAERLYCYSGPAFRYQSGAAQEDVAHPREFEQVGIEWFHGPDPTAAEARLAGLTAQALRRAGIADFNMRIGNPGLFRALLEKIDMPDRWRRRLRHQFWRPQAFHALLHSFCANGAAARSEERERQLLDELDGLGLAEAARKVEARLARENFPLVGGRRPEDIAARLLEQAADRAAEPLAQHAADLIEDYLSIDGEPEACLEKIGALTGAAGIDLSGPLDTFTRRIALLREEGFDMQKARFDAEFGRQFEYYSGFVFQMEAPGAEDEPLAGGGRYDDLLQHLGAPVPVPALGVALHSERIAAAGKAGGQ